MANSKTTRFICCILFIFAITSVSFFMRRGLKPIFDETIAIKFLQEQKLKENINSTDEYIKNHIRDIWYQPQSGIPSRPIKKRYRPLLMIHVLYNLLFSIDRNQPYIPIFINSLLLALAGIAIYLLGMKLTEDIFSSAGAAFLTVFSLPAITGTWVVTTGAHTLVPLITCLGIFCYIKYKEALSCRWLVLLGLILFTGPLYKEYLCLLAPTLFFAELISSKRNTRLLVFLMCAILYSFSPASIINIVFFKNPVFSSPFEKYISHVKTLNINFRLHAFNHLIFTIPPTISLLGIIAIYRNIFSKRLSGHKVNLAVILFLSILYASLFIPPDIFSLPWTNFLSFLLVLCISLSAFQINRILAVWFFIAWLPYILIYYVEVHLVYAIGPLAIILLWHISQFLKSLSSNKKRETISLVPLLLIILLCVAFVDQALNPIAAYRTFKATNDAAINIAHHLSRNDLESRQNILISNTLLGKDIEYYLKRNEKKHLKINGFTVKRDPVKKTQSYMHPLRFHGLLKDKREQSNIYLLDLDSYPTLMSRFINKSHFSFSLIYTNRTDISYPYTDPLKYFIPFEYTSYPGSPDLNDFAFINTGIFRRKITGNQLLYKMK